MKEIIVEAERPVEELTFAAEIGHEDRRSEVHLFELLVYPECKLTWSIVHQNGSFSYPSDDWLLDKLEELSQKHE